MRFLLRRRRRRWWLRPWIPVVPLALALALGVGGLGACSRGGGEYTVTAYFTSAISLYSDSQVRVLGLPAGHVRSVKVVGTKVRVVLAVHDDIPLPDNVEATIIPPTTAVAD